jgi:hypothetical protein
MNRALNRIPPPPREPRTPTFNFSCAICSQNVDLSGIAGGDYKVAENAVNQYMACADEAEAALKKGTAGAFVTSDVLTPPTAPTAPQAPLAGSAGAGVDSGATSSSAIYIIIGLIVIVLVIIAIVVAIVLSGGGDVSIPRALTPAAEI